VPTSEKYYFYDELSPKLGKLTINTQVLLTLLHCGVIDEPAVAGQHKRISKDRDIWLISPDVVLDEAPYRGMPALVK
jgi:hypothetical protein